VTIPFHVVGGLILIEADVEGHHGTFMLDTGAPMLFLNTAYVTPHDSTITAQASSAATGVVDVRLGVARTVQYGTAVRHRVRVAYMDLRALDRQVGQPVLGIFGVDQLSPFETVLDYRAGRIHLIPVDTNGHRMMPGSWMPATDSLSAPAEFAAPRRLVIQATLGGSLCYLLIDTGSPANYMKSVTQQKISTHLTIAPVDSSSVEQREAASTHSTLWSLDRLVVGPRTYATMRFAIPRPEDLALQHNTLGYPFLSTLGVVGLNFRAHQLYLYANSQ
jgi:hypothetical protein